MKNLHFVTLTGPDDTTSIDDLLAMSAQYPFIEWGILISARHHGYGRYPSLQWIKDFTNAVRGTEIRRALHVCGRMVGDFNAISLFADDFQRFQINFDADDLPVCVDTGAKLTAGDIDSYMLEHPKNTFIMQYTAGNAAFIDHITSPNCVVLFDESAGAGISPASWPTALDDKRCGYAGGMGPDNVIYEIGRVEQVCNGKPYWIDMETKIRGRWTERGDGAFDLPACKAVVDAIEKNGGGYAFSHFSAVFS
jgi:hypothetical protein